MTAIQWSAGAVVAPSAPPDLETAQLRVFHLAGHAPLSHPPGVVELQPRGRDLECPPELGHHRFGPLAGIGEAMTHNDVWALFVRLLLRRRGREATVHSYDIALHRLWEELDRRGIRWDRVTPEDVEMWLNDSRCRPRKRNAGLGWSPGTRHIYGQRVLTFYTVAAKRGWLRGGNPLEDWKPPRRPAPRPRGLPVAAIGTLLVELVDPRLRMMAMLEYYQLLRAGEICKLSVEDVRLNTDPPMLRIDGKGGKEQDMPISPALLPDLRTWLLLRPKAGPLIPNYRWPTEHLSARYGSRLLAAATRPIIGDSGHALRHTAAQQLRRLTRDPFIVMEALRHATLGQQSSYVGSDVDLLAAALAQLPDPLAKEV